MARSAFNALEKRQNIGIGKETLSFLGRKIGRIYPYFLFAYIVSIIIIVITSNMDIITAIKNIINSIWELLFLHQSGAQVYRWVGGDWYLSAMLMGMFIIYPLLRKFNEAYPRIIAPICGILFIGYFSQKYGHIHRTGDWNGIVYDSLIRGIGEMNIGITMFVLAEKLKTIQFTKLCRRLLSALACCLYLFVIIGMFFKSHSKWDFIWVLCLALGIAITGSNVGSLSQWINRLNPKPFATLGKYSMALYLNHIISKEIVNSYYEELAVGKRLLLFCGLAVILSILCMVVVKLISMLWKSYGPKLKKYIVQGQ